MMLHLGNHLVCLQGQVCRVFAGYSTPVSAVVPGLGAPPLLTVMKNPILQAFIGRKLITCIVGPALHDTEGLHKAHPEKQKLALIPQSLVV